MLQLIERGERCSRRDEMRGAMGGECQQERKWRRQGERNGREIALDECGASEGQRASLD